MTRGVKADAPTGPRCLMNNIATENDMWKCKLFFHILHNQHYF